MCLHILICLSQNKNKNNHNDNYFQNKALSMRIWDMDFVVKLSFSDVMISYFAVF